MHFSHCVYGFIKPFAILSFLSGGTVLIIDPVSDAVLGPHDTAGASCAGGAGATGAGATGIGVLYNPKLTTSFEINRICCY